MMSQRPRKPGRRGDGGQGGRPGRGKARAIVYSPPPVALKRPPRTDLKVRAAQLDEWAFAAVDAVVARLRGAIGESTSLDDLRWLETQSQMLLAMKDTHRVVRRLVEGGREEMELSLDALPVTRVQLERCFLALLLADEPGRWHARYRKNAWKAFAEKFFRDQRTLGHFEPFAEYFRGSGVRLLREFAHEMDVSEDEFQTVLVQVTGDEPDPRYKQWFIADMPTPARCIQELSDAAHRHLAGLLYPYYDNLSHFSHGGLVGLMEAAVLRGHAAAGEDRRERERFWQTTVLEQTLPLSYVAMLLVATLFARLCLDDEEPRRRLVRAWQPYHSDGSPLGVAIWDAWAAESLSE